MEDYDGDGDDDDDDHDVWPLLSRGARVSYVVGGRVGVGATHYSVRHGYLTHPHPYSLLIYTLAPRL